MELVYFVGSCLWIPVALKFGDWKSLKRYAASVYYVMLGSVLAVVITANRELWIYESPTYHIDDTIIELFITFVVFPSAFFVFLSRYPNGSGVLKPFLYITLWVGVFAGCEAFVHYYLRIMSYQNGWIISALHS
ncbi:CBO0543 family protein [Paenibacillus sp. Soil522]|uniref:CBO0543 family protein n=1 Tax=Paenibacillus sp. Soil522 TaxID=1736388 RepID=UPI0006F982B8|nr:CBO0543 family protein [Paenibacillus sp. Soil522]KRE29125.1 hypothetical protein ASG81_26590 [Paenibacillus sp. Soil522]